MSKHVSDIADFLLQLDGLKSIDRRTYINGGERVENSAEHSWHLAIASHTGNTIVELIDIWEEQDYGESKEAKLLKVVDRLLPIFHNITSQGRAWKDHGVNASQVRKVHRFIEGESPEIYEWFSEQLDYAIEQGWLDAS